MEKADSREELLAALDRAEHSVSSIDYMNMSGLAMYRSRDFALVAILRVLKRLIRGD
jgi:hypothetical protein